MTDDIRVHSDGGDRRELRMEHSYAEGTVLTGTRRDDDLYRLLRGHGWNYRRSVGDYRLQGSVDRPAKTGAITTTAAALRARGFAVTITIDTTPRAVADAEADRARRAHQRATRLSAAAQRAGAGADAHHAAAREVLDHIPLGQPLLVDHHSYAADRRRRDRAWRAEERATELAQAADTLATAAKTAAAHMTHRHSVETVANRIHRLEAELRALDRARTDLDQQGGAEPGGVARRHEQHVHLSGQLDYWRGVRAQQIADGEATQFGPADLAAGDLVLYRGLWLPVVRVNRRSVTVPHLLLGRATNTVRYAHITDLARADDPRRTTLAPLALAVAQGMLSNNQPLHPAWTTLKHTH